MDKKVCIRKPTLVSSVEREKGSPGGNVKDLSRQAGRQADRQKAECGGTEEAPNLGAGQTTNRM